MAADVQVVPATRAHAEALAPLMRPEDAAEALASGGYTPLAALLDALAHCPETWALLLGGEVAALFGAAPYPGQPGVGVVWALTGLAVDAHRKAFAHVSRHVVAELLERHPVLCNYVDARYTASVRWLRWLGAEVHPAQPFGHAGLPFHPFVFRRPS